MAGNSGGPWGGGGNNGDKGGRDERPTGNRGNSGGGRGPGDRPQIPEIDELVNKGREQLRVLMGGRGGGDRKNGTGGGTGGNGPMLNRGTIGLGVLAAVGIWAFASFYTVRPEQQSIELFLGEFSGIGTEGLNFAPWPFITAEVFDVTTNRAENIGVARNGDDNDGLMLTTDENIVDIDFQVVWNVKNARDFKFSLRDPQLAVRAISESAMREVIALDNRNTGINVIRVNFNKVDPPSQSVTVTDAQGNTTQQTVIDAFRDVQAAAQERDRVERQADAYANRRTAEARGESAQILEASEGYRARVVNDAVGEASRFEAVLNEYVEAPEVTRKRLYLETMEKVLGDVDKIILENDTGGGQGVVPYLPLNELGRSNGPSSNRGSN